jgi:DNA-binding transcriptional LysR family regulator
VWREPLVWAAAETFDLVPGAALPLALYRERSVCREAALAALNDNELTWEIIYTCPSLTGVCAAALAGLAITPLPASALIAACASSELKRGCRLFLTSSSRSTRRRGPTRPPRRWLRFCSRLHRDYHARRSEMDWHSDRAESLMPPKPTLSTSV